ncbi:hypothetical protein L6164_000859 [Bauhinia variegata]|uniref:Uncharacterized protein n=1 Tax=Bauhinia variegata TaxID=167791 RepID=A0ACB9Q953_BAUVA|nr:hypothetical protein L6164_000859 [Bauhinia variegata]
MLLNLKAFTSVWNADFDDNLLKFHEFEFLELRSISMRVRILLELAGGIDFLGNDLNPLEEQELEVSSRKSFSKRGLRSNGFNLFWRIVELEPMTLFGKKEN